MTENFIVAAAGHLLSPATSWSDAQPSEGRSSEENKEDQDQDQDQAASARQQQLCGSGELWNDEDSSKVVILEDEVACVLLSLFR